MRGNRFHQLLLAGLMAMALAVPLAASAGAAAPRVSGRTAYARLSADFHRILRVTGAQLRADQFRFQRTTDGCLTRALTALFEAQYPSSPDAGAALAANKQVLFEAGFQLIMQSSRRLLIPYVNAVKLATDASGLPASERRQMLAFANGFAAGTRLRTCADANAWAAADYSAASEPPGVKEIAAFAKALAGVARFAKTLHKHQLTGITPVQRAALKRLSQQANAHLQSAIKQISSRGGVWLEGVVVAANGAAKQYEATTTSTTTTPTTTTPTTTTP